jgi:hypothetical protein
LENDKLVNKHDTTGTTTARVVNKPATISLINFNLISIPDIALLPFCFGHASLAHLDVSYYTYNKNVVCDLFHMAKSNENYLPS